MDMANSAPEMGVLRLSIRCPLSAFQSVIGWCLYPVVFSVLLLLASPLLLKPVIAFVLGLAITGVIRRVLQMSFEISDSGVRAVNFFRECDADWDELVCVDDRGHIRSSFRGVPHRYRALRLVLKRRNGTRESFPLHVTIIPNKKTLEKLSTLRRELDEHGVPLKITHRSGSFFGFKQTAERHGTRRHRDGATNHRKRPRPDH